MLTFFTTAKVFKDHTDIIQRNALRSWTRLHPDVEVIVFGDEEGVAQVCSEYGLRHEPHVERHESGFKYLDYMFTRAQQIAQHGYLCYANCDIVFLPDFWHAFTISLAWKKQFLVVARRWDVDLTEPINFANPNWARDLREFAKSAGVCQHPEFKDFFVFPKGLYGHVPPLVVGRSAWDSWLVWRALDLKVPVIDATPLIVPVHQNHDHSYHPQGKQGTNEDALAMRNLGLCGNGRHLAHIWDSTHTITHYGKIRWTPFKKYLSRPLPSKIRYAVLIETLRLRNLLGLRTHLVDRALGRRTDFMD
jgi:hypothetical protein